MRYFLAIDQGGSKTEVLIFTEYGEILARADDRGMREPGESYGTSQGKWIRISTEKALNKAGISLSDLSGACCSLNGADWEEDYPRLSKLVSNELSMEENNIIIVNDCIGAMRGGADSGNRAVLCLGSGMNCAVRSSDGNEYVYGFFANSLDQGGGALGTRVWQSIIDAYNGLLEKTLLTDLILEKYGEKDLVSLYKKFTSNKIRFVNYDLSPLLMKAAKSNDKVAMEILENSGNRLVQYMEEGAKKLNLSNETITLVLTGGVFKGDGNIYFDIIERIVNEKKLNFVCVHARYEPVAGAALLLLDEFNISNREDALARFYEDAPLFDLCR